MMASSGFTGNVEHARAWLTERADSRERRERTTFSLEIVVVLLIGGEIVLGLWQDTSSHETSINNNRF